MESYIWVVSIIFFTVLAIVATFTSLQWIPASIVIAAYLWGRKRIAMPWDWEDRILYLDI